MPQGFASSTCVGEIAQHILQLLSSSTSQRRHINEHHWASLPQLDPQRLVLQLNVCKGVFPELRAETCAWSEVGMQGSGVLYKITTAPGAPPVYFTIQGHDVVRVGRRTK